MMMIILTPITNIEEPSCLLSASLLIWGTALGVSFELLTVLCCFLSLSVDISVVEVFGDMNSVVVYVIGDALVVVVIVVVAFVDVCHF